MAFVVTSQFHLVDHHCFFFSLLFARNVSSVGLTCAKFVRLNLYKFYAWLIISICVQPWLTNDLKSFSLSFSNSRNPSEDEEKKTGCKEFHFVSLLFLHRSPSTQQRHQSEDSSTTTTRRKKTKSERERGMQRWIYKCTQLFWLSSWSHSCRICSYRNSCPAGRPSMRWLRRRSECARRFLAR